MSNSVRHSNVAQNEAERSRRAERQAQHDQLLPQTSPCGRLLRATADAGHDNTIPCTKETVKPSGLNIWSSEAAVGPVPVVDIVAVQGLGAHEFYTWVKKVTKEEFKKRSWARMSRDENQPRRHSDGEDGPREVMWLRDLLVHLFKNARIATYSYESDWRDRHVKTSLRECAEQFLNILKQYRQHANVGS